MSNLRGILLFMFFLPLMFAAATKSSRKIDAEVKAITKSAILIDTHNDIPSFTIDGTDVGNAPQNHTDIGRLRQGGVGDVPRNVTDNMIRRSRKGRVIQINCNCGFCVAKSGR